MSEFDNTNRGVLFVNNKKAEGSKQPDRTGSLNVDGVDYFLDGWLKKSASGQPFMSVSVKRKDKQSEAPRQAAKPAPAKDGFEDFDESVPF